MLWHNNGKYPVALADRHQGGCITDGSRLGCDSYMDLRKIRYGRIARLGCMLRSLEGEDNQRIPI